MLRSRLLAPLALVALALSAPAASGQPSPAPLQGTFAMSGHVTVAVHVKGEHAGQSISRMWTFTPLCSATPCGSVSLTRSRLGGSDTLTLALQPSGNYIGTGRFYAPLRCRGRVRARGEAVPFTITVQITATTRTSAGALVTTGIAATYTNRKRTNLTRCVALPSYDSATYVGTLTTTTARAATALTPRSPAGS
jgi:hypothetical protein